MPANLFGVRLPSTSKLKLIQDIGKIKKNSKQKLYFFYSEFLLRANRNPFYRQVLNTADLSAIDGRGLLWSQLKMTETDVIPDFYRNYIAGLPSIIRLPLFIIMFLVECVFAIISGFYNLVFKIDFSQKIQNELVLGRDFVYTLFEIAEKKKWKTLVVGGNSDNSDIIRSQILQHYPKLLLDIWAKSFDSDLMRDKVSGDFEQKMKQDGLVLNSANLFNAFPELKNARDYIKKVKPDLILVCIGGQSGKQEFFIDQLSSDPAVSFALATGVGAALDHLGAGANQKKPPVWLTQSGLEWVFRFLTQPYRRARIWDSIVTLWWWTTLQQFIIDLPTRPTAVNLIYREIEKKEGYEYLLVRRRQILAGDVAWSFVQGGVEKDESVELAGLREVKEEVDLDNSDFRLLSEAKMVNSEKYPVSFIRFVALGAQYSGSKNYLNVMEYQGSSEAKVNWENAEARWFEQDKVDQYLSQEKKPIWEFFEN
jgi:UDP-N-acetyl-D-mannosaminuronic acid transferase (WecB/TagA/CpsF family)/8-oxo-dGTP pyrophosphatase MutT (NUDIX family)